MARITNYQMSYLLSISTHRAKYPVVRWIEEKMDKENKSEWNGWMGEGLLECVHVSLGGNGLSYYLNENMKVVSVFGETLEGVSEPSKSDIDFLQAVNPEEYSFQQELCCGVLQQMFARPHSCLIQPEYKTSKCRCGETGIVNYYSGYRWEYYCGGGPRCCP